VRNLPDGAVEVIAEADEQMLNALIGELQKGPLLAKVQHVIVDWSDAKNCYTDFQIAYE
jgi:acylphosphatase